MMRRHITALALSFLVCPLPAGAQQPARDTAVAPTRIGSSTVSGRITLGDTAATPVRRAIVTVVAADGLDPRSALTDDTGAFSIGGLQEGRYTLTAKKPAHLTSAYGARRPERAGTAVVVAAGQHVDKVEWTLPRGAVLAGRITLVGGEPVPNTTVLAIPEREATTGGMLGSSETLFQTDDSGAFRIYGLSPGRYLLSAVPAFGRGEFVRPTESDYEAAVRTMRQTAPAVPGAVATTVAAATSERPVGFAPVYFPGTAVQSDAAILTVAAGDVKEGLDFAVSPVPIATVRGVVIGTNGQPTDAATISVDSVGPALPIAVGIAARANRPNSRGEFTISSMSPGVYRIRVRAGGVTVGTGGSFSVAGDKQQEWAFTEVNVNGEDIDGLRLVLQPGLTFAGRLSAAASAEAPVSWKGATIVVDPGATTSATVLNGLGSGPSPRSASVGDDGVFSVGGLAPGQYEIRVTLPAGLSGRWSLATVRHNDRDLRDAPLTFDQGSINGVDVVVTSTPAELSGRLTSESGAPATDYFIVAFPADRTLWHRASPRLRVMRPAADGLFSTRDLPPGTYRLAALTDVEPDEHRRAEFLESIYESAISVTVAAGTVTKQDVRIK